MTDNSSHSQNWYVYILLCADASLYTGITTNCERRVNEHNSNDKLAAKYTRVRRPVTLVWSEPHQDRSAASSREYHIKRLSRAQKLQLIHSHQFCQ
ncbi:MAG: GIY-YIG nuclease family protein [Neptunomonas phycophila]|uniref:GIY-YIG nuclease family protein n=1 Tax=Neptunomonas phycophila TaxID=1572645 RepID=UPI003B8E9679